MRSWSFAVPGSTLTTPEVAVGIAAGGADEIAVIGMAGQFPGATDVDAFWRNLVAGKNCTGELPAFYRDPTSSDA